MPAAAVPTTRINVQSSPMAPPIWTNRAISISGTASKIRKRRIVDKPFLQCRKCLLSIDEINIGIELQGRNCRRSQIVHSIGTPVFRESTNFSAFKEGIAYRASAFEAS